jgi:hypothetical protein
MPTQAFYNGDVYQCITDADVNQSPATHPAKWSRIQIPKAWRAVLARLTYAHLLELDGQKDKAVAELAAAREGDHGLDDLIRDEARGEEWRCRPNVERHALRR